METKKVLIWGTFAFVVQTICGLFIPVVFIRTLGVEGFGQLSFFMWLLHPGFWFDFTGNLNAGLLSKLSSNDPSQSSNLLHRYYTATWFWWSLVWFGITFAAYALSISFFAFTSLLALILLPLCITGGYILILDYYRTQQFIKVYQFQIITIISWLGGIWILSHWIPMKESLLIFTMMIGGFFWIISYCNHSFSKASDFDRIYDFRCSPFQLKVKEIETLGYRYWNHFRSSLQYQSLFFLQASLGIITLQVDRIIIANLSSWENVSYYIVPIAILFKFPALLAFFTKPLLTQLSQMHVENNFKAIQHTFFIVLWGCVGMGMIMILPLSLYFVPLVSFWLNLEFAQQALPVIQPLIWLLPFAIWVMMCQSFYIALGYEKIFNLACIGITLLHWIGIILGEYYWGKQGISFGFFAEAFGGMLMASYLACHIYPFAERLKFGILFLFHLLLWIGMITGIQFLTHSSPSIGFILSIIVVQSLGVLGFGTWLWRKSRSVL
ncbi:hypothetical protein WDW89_02245 [Deltaproteobacteria bacterium TL4]